MSKSRDLGEFPAAALDIDASGNVSVTGDVSLADNDKLILGTGSDLQIYHSGSTAVINNDVGHILIENTSDDKDIYIKSDDGAGGSATYIQVDGGAGSVNLRHYGLPKLATTATGIDVTGTVTADGLTVDGGATVNGSTVINTDAIDSGVILSLEGNRSTDGAIGSIFFANGGDSVGLIRSSRAGADDAADMLFYTQPAGGANTQRMQISSSGNLGIGTSSPSYKTVISDGGASGIEFGPAYSGTSNLIQHYSRSGAVYVDVVNVAAMHRFNIGATEKMRIDSAGRLLLNTSSAIFAASEALHMEGIESGTASYGIFAHGSAGTNYFVRAYRGDNLSGSISYTANGLYLTTVSDERLKENISNANDAGEKIDAINVRQFDWKQSGDHQEYGMIAQELIKVAPDAVHAPEDPEDMMGVDYAKLVPMLIKEVQSLRARVSALESI